MGLLLESWGWLYSETWRRTQLDHTEAVEVFCCCSGWFPARINNKKGYKFKVVFEFRCDKPQGKLTWKLWFWVEQRQITRAGFEPATFGAESCSPKVRSLPILSIPLHQSEAIQHVLPCYQGSHQRLRYNLGSGSSGVTLSWTSFQLWLETSSYTAPQS